MSGIGEICQQKLEELRELSFVELLKRSGRSEETETSSSNRITTTVFIDKVGTEVLRVVVQVYKRGKLGVLNKVSADGFRVDQLNRIHPLAPGEIYEFM